jgi:hypothetical protein
MTVDEFLKPFDNFFISLNNNKIILLLVLVLLGIYITHFNQHIVIKSMDLFDNNSFRLIIFIIITYISSSSPAIGISLAIIMLVSMQLITSIKFKKEFESNMGINITSDPQENSNQVENFSQMEPVDMSYLSDEYMENPLEKMDKLSPPINFDLKLIKPKDYYMEMIKKGKMLLDDSYDLEQDLKKRYDIREQQIATMTKRNGTELVDSGLNRLQRADQGEYNPIGLKKKKTNRFIRYSKLIEKNKNNPSILASYNELVHNYDLLVSKQLDEKNFEEQLEKVYLSELDLLETVYKYKKNNMSEQRKKQINDELTMIKKLKVENKDWKENLKNLLVLIQQ